MSALLFITDKSKYPLQYFIQMILDSPEHIYASNASIPTQTLKYAAVVFGSLPMILLYPFLQKFYINGMVMGSVKE
jgi:putative aldouronate transport system permease protein